MYRRNKNRRTAPLAHERKPETEAEEEVFNNALQVETVRLNEKEETKDSPTGKEARAREDRSFNPP